MSGGELAVVLASVAVVVAVAVLGAIGVTLNRALRDLRRLLGEIRRDLLPAVQRIEEASGQVTGEVQRVGGLLDVAERVSERAETLSKATTRALLEPLAAVASLLRRGSPSRPTAAVTGEPAAIGRDGAGAAAARRPRRAPWARRLTAYLLRAGYRSTSALVAARLAAAQAQIRVGAARLAAAQAQRGVARAARSAPPDATARGGASTGVAGAGREKAPSGPPDLGARFLESIREVSREISEAMEEGRQVLRDGWETDDRSK